MRTMKHLALAAAAAAALALAGCGGGGSSGTASTPTETQQTPEMLASTAAGALNAAEAAVALVTEDSDDMAVSAAESAVADAVEAVAAASEADNHAALSRQLGNVESMLASNKAARMAAMDEQDADDMKAMTAQAKALKMAIDNIAGRTTAAPAPVVTTASIPTFDADGDSNTTDPTTAIPLKKGDGTVPALGTWMGADYSGMVGTGDAKTTGMARVYSNADADKVKSIAFTGEAAGLPRHAATTDVLGDYTVDSTNNDNIESSSLPETGTTTLDDDNREFMGTFMGAPGTYECTSSGDCTVTPDGVSGGTWTFTPSVGAMLEMVTEDATYLQFGWWVRKDADGDPTHAGVFTGVVSPSGSPLAALDATAINAISGEEATYVGSAAGKFAVSDPLDAARDNAGHFTADAELKAEFSSASMLSGTIDGFRLNDGSEDPGWSVELKKAGLTGSAFTGSMTEWSIDGSKGGASGQWQAQMYEDADDGNTTPDSVTGTFRSTIGDRHSLVGAFGAERMPASQ